MSFLRYPSLDFILCWDLANALDLAVYNYSRGAENAMFGYFHDIGHLIYLSI